MNVFISVSYKGNVSIEISTYYYTMIAIFFNCGSDFF